MAIDLKERSRKWQITENNPQFTKREAVEKLCGLAETIYCIGCSETGESGTKHVHAFAVYKNAITLGSIKKAFPRAHIEHCRGSNVSNRDYLVKSDNEAYEVGEMPLTSYEKPEDIASEVVGLLGQGKTTLEILTTEAHLCDYVVKHFRSLCEIEQAMSRRRKR